jgi:hypothetical protein
MLCREGYVNKGDDMFKYLVLATPLMVLASTAALADQCELVPKEVAVKALPFFQKAGGAMQAYCPGCGDTKAKSIKFKAADAHQDKDNASYWSVVLDGDVVDLAYAYVRVGDSKEWTNVGALAQCDMSEAPPRTLPANLVDSGG